MNSELKIETISDSKLERKTIIELLGKYFFIPSYQIGYRWKKENVKALLDHIRKFAKNKKRHLNFIVSNHL